MTPPLTDTEYSSSARAALIAIARWLESPCALLSVDAQQRFITMVADKVLPVVNSEPHLRGAAIEAVAKAVEVRERVDIEMVRRERDDYRGIIACLTSALQNSRPRSPSAKPARDDALAKALKLFS